MERSLLRSASARTGIASSRRQKRTRIAGGTASSITERRNGFPARSSLATISESADVWGTHVSTTCPWISRQSMRASTRGSPLLLRFVFGLLLQHVSRAHDASLAALLQLAGELVER